MGPKFLLLFTAFLTVSTALSTPTKRASAKQYQFITDGSFEDIPSSYASTFNFQNGDWKFKNRASIEYNNGTDNTPYGNVYAIFYNDDPSQTLGSVQQEKYSLSGTCTLSYAYNDFLNTVGCTLRATWGGVTEGTQIVDSVVFSASKRSSTQWVTRTAKFKPAEESGNLKFTLVCGSGGSWEVHLDNVSLTGPPPPKISDAA